MDKGARRTMNKIFSSRNVYLILGSGSTVNDLQRRFGEIGADVQKYKRRGD